MKMRSDAQMRALKEALEKSIDAGLKEESLKALSGKVYDALTDAKADFEYWLKEDASANLSSFVCDMVDRAVEALLEGNEAAMRSYLSCDSSGYTGRTDSAYPSEHSVIHGKLSHYGVLGLRKKIVDAHAELLKNERILDLEDQVQDLVRQINKLREREHELVQQLNRV